MPLTFNIESIDVNNISEEEAVEVAEAIRIAIEKESRKEIDEVLATHEFRSSSASSNSVTLGQNKTLTTGAAGTNGTRIWGATINPTAEASHTLFTKIGRELAFSRAGLGGCNAWAAVGDSFNVSGTGSRNATIRMIGTMKGDTESFGGASASTNITFKIIDVTNKNNPKEIGTQPVYSKAASSTLPTKYTVNQGFDVTKSVKLEASHRYQAYILIEGVAASVVDVGSAGSDFGPWDDSDQTQGVRYSTIYINF